MEFVAVSFYAFFSASFNGWYIKITHRKYKSIKTEEFEFKMQYMMIDGYKTKNRLGATIQEVIGKDVEVELVGKHIILRKWDELEKKHLYACFDVDKPRHLAKVVTVK